jgi:hypothetical protein
MKNREFVPNWGQNIIRAIFFIIWLVFLGWIVASDVAGQIPQPVQVSVSQTVRVSVPDAGGNSMGSGTYLGDGLYTTAWHVMRDNPTAVATIRWSDGRQFTAKLVAKDPVFDQAVLESVDKPRGGVPLASANLAIGGRVYFAGYSSGTLQPWEAKVRAYASPGQGSPSDWISADGSRPSIGGDSGGPVFDATGCYVGCLWGGSAPSSTVANNFGRTQRFLLPWNARLSAWQSQGYGCQQGYCPPQQQAQLPAGNGRQVEIGGNNPTQPQGNLRWPSGPPQPQVNPADLAKQVADMLASDDRLKGPKGDRGEQGPKGDPGKLVQITDEQLAIISAAVYQKMQSDPAFRGKPGKDGSGVSAADIERIKAEVLASIPDLRVLLVDGSTGSVIDDETYKPGEPLVLDFQRVINAARQR